MNSFCWICWRRFLLCIQQLALLSLVPATPSASPRSHKSHSEPPEARWISTRDRCALHALCAALFSLVGALYEPEDQQLRASFEPVREYIAGVVRARQQRAPFLLPSSAFYEYNWVLEHSSSSASSACVRTFAPEPASDSEGHMRHVRDRPPCALEELTKDAAAIAASRPNALAVSATNASAATAPLDPSIVASPAQLPAEADLFFDPAALSSLLEQHGFKAEELALLASPFVLFAGAQLAGFVGMRQSVTSTSIASLIGPQDDLDARLINTFGVSPPDAVRGNDVRATQSDRMDNGQRTFNLQDTDERTIADNVSLASNWQIADERRDSLSNAFRTPFPPPSPPSAPTVDDPQLDALLLTLAPSARDEFVSLPPAERAKRFVELLGSLQYDHYVSLSKRQCDAMRAANELIELPDTSNPANGAEEQISNDLELRVETPTQPAGSNGGLMQKSGLSNNSSSSARDSREYSPLISSDL